MGVRVRGTRDGPPRVDLGLGHCRYRRPVIYLSVGVEHVQRHGLAWDPHRTSSRTAHRARVGLADKAEARLGAVTRMDVLAKEGYCVLGLGYLTTRTGH